MKHIFKQGEKDSPVLLLLHGTGGDEKSLLKFGEYIDEKASILSVKGNIDENGMARFFRRLEEGVFDEEDLIFRTKELNDFLGKSREKYKFKRNNVVAIGYSNGANIGASLLLLYPDSLKAAILHHPMVPLRNVEKKLLNSKNIFIGAGDNDPICKPEETSELKNMLKELNANVYIHWESNGHNLTNTEIEAAKEWYKDNIK